MGLTKLVNIFKTYAGTALMTFLICWPAFASAQSGKKPSTLRRSGTQQQTTQGVGSNTKQGSDSKATQQLAMEGYCPVCIVDMKKWVAGDARFQSTFDGKTYRFPAATQKATFDANPAKYAPVLGGDCVVALKKMNKRVPGNIRQAAFYGSRLFLFANEMAKNEFLANLEAYANVDLALGGKCTVCKVEMKKDVAGKPEISTVFHGMRYFFPTKEQQAMFHTNPKKYAVGQPSGSGSK